jgi:hypothetical protein
MPEISSVSTVRRLRPLPIRRPVYRRGPAGTGRSRRRRSGAYDRLLQALVYAGAAAFVLAAPLAPVILKVAIVLLATAFYGITVVAWRRGRASRTWPATGGLVLECGLQRWRAADPPSVFRRLHLAVRIGYSYEVGGRRYVGSRIDYALVGSRIARNEAAREACDRYVVGRPVTVYHDPARPGRALLAPGFSADWVAVGYLIGLAIGAGRAVLPALARLLASSPLSLLTFAP